VSGLFFINCTGCWAKNVRFVKNNTATSSSGVFGLYTLNVMGSSFVDNYFYGAPTTQVIAIYNVAVHLTSSSLFQNNIIHKSPNGIVMNDPYFRNVVAYNYFDTLEQASIILHGLGGMNLYEGNNGKNFSGDVIHSSHAFETIFRGHWDG